MGFHQQWTMWLWRNPDNVTHRQLLSIDQVWRRSTALTWSRWGCRRLADNIWLLAHDNSNQHLQQIQQLYLSGLMHGSIHLLSTSHSSLIQPSVLLVSTYLGVWSTLNRFRTGHGRCAANLVRWHQASDPSSICGNPRQTMDHIVNHCPIIDFLVVYGNYIEPMKTLFHGWAGKARDRRSGRLHMGHERND